MQIGRLFGTPELKIVQKMKKQANGNTIVRIRYKGFVVMRMHSLVKTEFNPDNEKSVFSGVN